MSDQQVLSNDSTPWRYYYEVKQITKGAYLNITLYKMNVIYTASFHEKCQEEEDNR
jgi:hypothetical protein